MSSRWLTLGTLTLLALPESALLAQAPKADRSEALPPVVQVMAREPLDEEELVVEVIKAMPRSREDIKKAELGDNFKVIKVKRDRTDEPTHITPIVDEGVKTADKVDKVEKVEKAVSKPAKVEEPLQFVSPEKQKALPTAATTPAAPAVLMELKQPRVLKAPTRTEPVVKQEWSLPELSWPEALTPHSSILGGDPSTTFLPTLAHSNVSWIDTALPATQVRLRYDYRLNNKTHDRAEFWTARNQQYFDGENIGGRGFEVPESNIDLMEWSPYIEWAISQRVSVFAELPLRYIRPDENPSAFGVSDFNIGFKVAYFFMPEQVQTFQLRLGLPSGSSERGLGTGHVVIEPGLLLWQKLTEKLTMESELRSWIAAGGTNYSSFVLRYATGLSYDLYTSDTVSVKPVLEVLGWTVMRGYQSEFRDTLPTSQVTGDARGTVIELAPGIRATTMGNLDWYLGYSFNITHSAWFEDNLRLEVRWRY